MVPLELNEVVGTGAAALLFAVTFLVGGRLHPPRLLIPDHRTLVSFGVGMSVAYVFVHLMPELHGVRIAFAERPPCRFGMRVWRSTSWRWSAFWDSMAWIICGRTSGEALIREKRDRPSSSMSAASRHTSG